MEESHLCSYTLTFFSDVVGRKVTLLSVFQLPHPPIFIVFVENHDPVALAEVQLVRSLRGVIVERHHTPVVGRLLLRCRRVEREVGRATLTLLDGGNFMTNQLFKSFPKKQ